MTRLKLLRNPNRTILKATAKSCVTPKHKYLTSLTAYTESPSVSLSRLVELLKKRTEHSDCIVTLKALIIVHHLMCFGSESFLRYLAITHCVFRRNPGMRFPVACKMATFIEKYMEYLNVRVRSARDISVDFCCENRDRSLDSKSTFRADETLQRIDLIQEQLYALLLFSRASKEDFCNSMVLLAFSHISEDLINLFKYLTKLMTTLLEESRPAGWRRKSHQQDILACCVRFHEIMSRIQNFGFVAEVIKEYIDFEKISTDFSVLEARHDGSLEFQDQSPLLQGSKQDNEPINVAPGAHSFQQSLRRGGIDYEVEVDLIAFED